MLCHASLALLLPLSLICSWCLGTAVGASGTSQHDNMGCGSPEEWMGFQAVWRAATTLHGIVVERLCRANVPCISFSPSAVCMCSDGRAVQWDISPLLAAIDAGLVPVVHGDVCFDTRRGGTVLSTESVFAFLAEQFCSLKRRVDRVMVCGIEDRVYSDFPHNTTLLATVGDRHVSAGNDNDQKPNDSRNNSHKTTCSGGIDADTSLLATTSSPSPVSAICGSRYSVDTTGGMLSKVCALLAIDRQLRFHDLMEGRDSKEDERRCNGPSVRCMIFSGRSSDTMAAALRGEVQGTSVVSVGRTIRDRDG